MKQQVYLYNLSKLLYNSNFSLHEAIGLDTIEKKIDVNQNIIYKNQNYCY